MNSAGSLVAGLKQAASELGFSQLGIANAMTPPGWPRLVEWLDAGFAGEMHYLPGRRQAYEHPAHVLPAVASVIMVSLNYKTGPSPRIEPAAKLAEPLVARVGRVARYAQPPRDYHDLLRERLRQLADWLHARSPGCRTRAVVDTAPLLERDFARLAGLGWFGKNTLLIDKRLGSWTVLGALLTDLVLPADQPHESSHCGTCRRCLDVCPTQAFPQPGVLDARRCVAYLTIELRAAIPVELRPGLRDWVFGCDLCQDVCPWNVRAPVSADPDQQPSIHHAQLDPVELLHLTEAEFREHFRGTPLERTGRACMARNAAIVLGNARDRAVVPDLIASLEHDPAEIVRAAAAWALGQLRTEPAIAALEQRFRDEPADDVRTEIRDALARSAGEKTA